MIERIRERLEAFAARQPPNLGNETETSFFFAFLAASLTRQPPNLGNETETQATTLATVKGELANHPISATRLKLAVRVEGHGSPRVSPTTQSRQRD